MANIPGCQIVDLIDRGHGDVYCVRGGTGGQPAGNYQLLRQFHYAPIQDEHGSRFDQTQPFPGLHGVAPAALVLNRLGDEKIVLAPLLLPPAPRHGLARSCGRVRTSVSSEVADDSGFQIFVALRETAAIARRSVGGILNGG